MPRKQFKLKSHLSVTDGREIQLEFQNRTPKPRRVPIYNRSSQSSVHHSNACEVRVGTMGPSPLSLLRVRGMGPGTMLHPTRHTKASGEAQNGRSGFAPSLIILYSPNVSKTRTCKTTQRFMSQVAKWPFGFFRNWFGFL